MKGSVDVVLEKYEIAGEDAEPLKKRFMIFAAVGFLIGIVAANTFCKSTIMELGMFGDYFFMQLKQVQIDKYTLFWQIFEKRMFFVFLVLFLCGTGFVRQMNCILAIWVGNSLGLFLSASIIQQGVAGIVLCIGGLLPHYILYIPAGILLMIRSVRFSDRLYGKKNTANFRKDLLMYLTGSLVLIAVFFVGIILETTLNPYFLQKIYNFFNNIW